ncbi:MAG: dihydroorotate dehydrogenase [Candidatus Marinimicrobia bacterium]|nr:dihydroorotate dehydrogenase [Candidatus Neomarinimicrobiota bacterium]
MANLTIQLGRDVTLSNPVMAASGTFGYGDEVPDLVDVNQLGGLVTKSLTLRPNEGHAPPRIVETPAGLLNAIGLANIGVEAFCAGKLPFLETLQTQVFVSIAGATVGEYVDILTAIERSGNKIAGYEINISCPNVDEGGMEFGVSASITETLTAKLRQLTGRFIMIKLSPNVTHIDAIAKAAESGGADGISAINTVVGLDMDPLTGQRSLSNLIGGLSGPAIRPIALAAVHSIAGAVSLPVIGMGGISSAEDIIRFVRAGATAVQIGTANYRDPAVGVNLLARLEQLMEQMQIETLEEIRGVIH